MDGWMDLIFKITGFNIRLTLKTRAAATKVAGLVLKSLSHWALILLHT